MQNSPILLTVLIYLKSSVSKQQKLSTEQSSQSNTAAWHPWHSRDWNRPFSTIWRSSRNHIKATDQKGTPTNSRDHDPSKQNFFKGALKRINETKAWYLEFGGIWTQHIKKEHKVRARNLNQTQSVRSNSSLHQNLSDFVKTQPNSKVFSS